MGLKVLCYLLILFLGGNVMRFENLVDSFDKVAEMVVTIENVETKLEKGNDKYEEIMLALKEITHNSHEMPAFGVSIDNLTREEMAKGTWLELNFDTTCKLEGMDFDGLLIKVEKGWHGFNLIRKNNGKYDGRCFYLSLENSMDKLYGVIHETALNNDKK